MMGIEDAGMVIGMGTDLIEIARVQASIDRYGDQFLRRVFTEEEISYCLRKRKTAAESFAARFAAKEAGAKALGTGIAQGVGWKEIEVSRKPGQRPEIGFTGRAAERAKIMGMTQASLSLTHSRETAMAVVILEGM